MIAQILEYRSKGLTQKQIASEMKISSKTVWKLLKSENLVTPITSGSLVHNFFTVIDAEEKAYILGLLMADGYVNVRRNLISITLKESDTHILERIDQCWNNSKSINISTKINGKLYMRTTIHSKQMLSDLMKLGCVERKTYTNSHFPVIPDDMVRHFIRGFFDGDGHVGMHPSNGRMNYIWSILVQENYKDHFIEIIKRSTGVSMRPSLKKECKNNLFVIRCGLRRDLLKIYHYLYDDSSIFLHRKKDKWDEIVKSISRKLNH